MPGAIARMAEHVKHGFAGCRLSPLMPETPDFDQIARTILEASDGEPGEGRIAEQLRLVWNARGAADIAKIETELSMLMGPTTAGPYVKNLDRALRTLDRSG